LTKDAMEPIINPEFSALVPPLAPGERDQLEANIRAEGCLDPLIVWRGSGILLDGHHRLEICKRHGIEFEVVELSMDDEAAARLWIANHQLGKRNLTPFQRAELALLVEEPIRRRAKENQGTRTDLLATLPEGGSRGIIEGAQPIPKPVDTREELASMAGVSGRTMDKAKKVAAEAEPEVKEALRKGETTINAEYKRLTDPGAHVGHNSGNNEWYTPGKYIEAARRAMGTIDLDPASSAEANKVVNAAEFFTVEDDGLAREWSGNVWMNPPYAQPLIAQFCARLAEHVESGAVVSAVVLTNNATETGWWQRLASCASAVCLPAGRVKFWAPGKATAAPLQGQSLIYFGSNVEGFRDEFKSFGIICSIA
jgi:phage N-6-adenine-methyltransferase